MRCYACGRKATGRCLNCGNDFCARHGNGLCRDCAPSVGFLSSHLLYRGVVFGFVLVVAFSSWVFYWEPNQGRSASLASTSPEPTPTMTVQVRRLESLPTPTAVPTHEPTRPTPTATPTAIVEQTHTVEADDTLISIAERFGVTVEEIARLNGIEDDALLQIGQVLQIPVLSQPTATPTPAPATPTAIPTAVSYTSYAVQAGDTLYTIALSFGTTVEELSALNGIDSPDELQIGQVLRVPER